MTNKHEETKRCRARVWRPHSGHSEPCSKRAVRDGYCGVHHPDAVQKRAALHRERSAAQLAAQRAQWERRKWEIQAAQACEGMTDPVAEVKALRANAERYRYLREEFENDAADCVWLNVRFSVSECRPDMSHVDDAIDRAIGLGEEG